MLSERLAGVRSERPKRQATLESQRAEVRVKLENLDRALEGGASASAVVQAIHMHENRNWLPWSENSVSPRGPSMTI